MHVYCIKVGFNAGDTVNYFTVPASRTAAIVDIETTSNVKYNWEIHVSNRSGQYRVVWMYRRSVKTYILFLISTHIGALQTKLQTSRKILTF